ncbi:MAG: BspA family leucine-rich repeat surface protein [Erysipelotrichaceae bacterium]|nr:BspA family leucine-rich repeat surface protein [Erysipelotrichaceae bacterium]
MNSIIRRMMGIVLAGTILFLSVGNGILLKTEADETSSVLAEYIEVKELASVMTPDSVFYIDAAVNPKEATVKHLVYESSDESVVTVNSEGKMKAVSYGTATIRISTCDGSNITEEYTVRVMDSRAYGIIQDNGDFVFFRSNNEYDDKQVATVIDITGKEYTGTVYTDIESTMYKDYYKTPWYDNCSKVKKAYVAEGSEIYPISLRQWFWNMPNLKDCSVKGINSENVRNMFAMFADSGIEEIDLTGLNTCNVRDMSHMFIHCYKLRNVIINSLDTSNVTTTTMMFDSASSLKSVDLSGMDFSNCMDMSQMFSNCYSLQKINMNIKTDKLEKIEMMFAYCQELKELDLSSMNFDNLKQAPRCFAYCTSLTRVDLSTFNTAECVFSQPFIGCDSLNEVVLGPKMTKMEYYSGELLPQGTWTNGKLTKSEKELALEYPKHAREWAGSWKKTSNGKTVLAVRIAGDNRFGTSQLISKFYLENSDYDKFDAVVLANGDNFADALAGSCLSARKDAPIIITREGKEKEVNDYIKTVLKPQGTIYILGGTAAVPETCLTGLNDQGYDLVRLAGDNRYLTNMAILNYVGNQYDPVFIATGNNFADSLSASATGLPIMLVTGSTLRPEQKEYLNNHLNKAFIILGGENAVSRSIENELENIGEVSRISGRNRAETSINIAKRWFPYSNRVIIAYTHDFPDGLCGGPLAYKLNEVPLILTRDADAEMTAQYIKEKGYSMGYVLGGTGRLSDALIRKIFNMKASDKIVDYK